jgi:hypothetical protein
VTIRPGLRDLSWTAAGTLLLIVIAMLVLHSYREKDIATESALRAKRVELVEQMRAALSSASEAEKSAVMATTDQESQSFAEKSRVASSVVEKMRDDLAELLRNGGTGGERDLLSQFSLALGECQRIDRELLDLAVRNTNLKAYGLAFGPAADALANMDGALSRILEMGATSPDPQARKVLLLAANAQSGALRIQALLPPHISEESNKKMDELEGRMANEDRKVRSDLKELAALLRSGRPDLEMAASSYAQFTELKTQILELSRQNTNVRSLIISLNEKRKAVEICQGTLEALKKAIQEELLAEKPPENPR